MRGGLDFSADVYLLADCLFLEIRGSYFFLSLLLRNWSGVVHAAVGPIELDILNGPNVDYFALRNSRSSRLRVRAFPEICLLTGFTAFLVLASLLSDHLIIHLIEAEQFALILHEFLAESAPSIEFSSRIDKEEAIVLFMLDLPHYEILNDL